MTPEADTPGAAPRRTFVGDTASTELLVSDRRCLMSAPLSDAVRSPGGSASPGMILALFDVGASHPTMIACRPDWTATQDISLHGADPISEGPIVVDSQLVRVGKKITIASATVYDGHGVDDIEKLQRLIDQAEPPEAPAGLTRAGAGLITFARLPRAAAAGMGDYDPGKWIGQVRRTGTGTPVEGSLHERLGLRLIEPRTGRFDLDRTPYVTNSIGTILGGAQAVMIEAAAEAMRPGLVATDLQIHFLSQVRKGPARTAGTVLRDADDHSVVTVRVTDAGHDNQILALATVTLRRR
ncbi:PaaI family thioesterase [Parafrankia discariae]|uniref:PaaI family thioesterase n=1 Tax=Parafrankia discariae TaxID=365528 RepID=UPI00037CF486|nr:acyl-CoA thioesterase domain-containing protein [Parafrankia discariae]